MKSSRPKVEPILQPTLFQMDQAAELTSQPKTARPNSLPGILLGTSAFTANGWQGSFYPPGMRSRDFLSYYATQFAMVEVDSTFYGCPSARTVSNLRPKGTRLTDCCLSYLCATNTVPAEEPTVTAASSWCVTPSESR